MAPHGWLRYDVKRIRSVRHLTDPIPARRTRGSVVFYARRYLGLRLNKALSCTNKRDSRRAVGWYRRAVGWCGRGAGWCGRGAARLVGRRRDRGRGGADRIPVFLVTLVLIPILIPGVRVFGEDPRGEIRVVQVPAESLDGLFVDHVVRSGGQIGVRWNLLMSPVARLVAGLVARLVAFRGRLLGPLPDVVGDAPAQVVSDG